MGRARHKRYLLWAGVAAPVICFTTALLAPLAFPHFNWSTQYLSELGDPAAPHPWIFNGGVILGAIAGMAAGVGFFLALRDLTGRTVVPAIIARTAGISRRVRRSQKSIRENAPAAWRRVTTPAIT